MKHGWEYTRFGDIIKPAKNVRNGVREKLPVLSITMRGGIVKQNDRFKKVIASRDTANYKVVKRGQLVIAFPIDEGLIYTQEVVEEGIMSPAYDVYDIDCTYINRQFLVNYFHCPQAMKYYKDKLRGTTQRRRMLPKEDLYALLIPVPPLPVQEQICSLLDKINRVIEAKKEQLKELDTLAQAIFYDMFGDPVTNEKGWEVKKLCEVSTLLNGRAYKQDELLNEGKYKVLRVGNFFTNGDYYYSNLELDDDKYCDKGDLLFAWSASFGAFIWGGSKVIYHYHIWKVLYDESKLNKLYYQYLLNKMTQSFMKDVHGIGMVHLTKAGMEQYIIPIPPLPLQQAFAEKVEAIERQKELINQSLREVQTLFDSRMDYWFSEEDDDFGQLDKLD